MDCPECGSETVAFAVPADLREYLPGEEPGAALCTVCLALRPAADPPADTPDFDRVSDGLPSDAAAAVPLALLVGLLSSLVTNRAEISALLERVERAGTDPLLALDRLAADPAIDADVDLRTRRRQLEQLL